MTAEMRNCLTPEGYIRMMFKETENGKFTFEYENPDKYFTEEIKTFNLNWTEEDAEMIEQKYASLAMDLTNIARYFDESEIEEKLNELLNEWRDREEVIDRAFRYAECVKLNAPYSVLTEEGRCLAEEMVLYYAGNKELN